MKMSAVLVLCYLIMLGLTIPKAHSETFNGPTAQQRFNLSSPEATWDHFKAAMLEGNYELALEYCCPTKSKFVDKLRKFGQEKTGKVFRTVTSIEKVYQDNDSAKYRVHRDVNGTNLTTYVSFAKIDDQWKIDEY